MKAPLTGGNGPLRFSIIVPVYNQQSYIGECLDSVLGQAFTDYEIIAVDDGSTDGSAVVCDTYAANNGEIIKVIHQQNTGPSIARNNGVSAAEGDYIIFLDGDDILADGALDAVNDAIIRCNEPDLIVCRIDRFSDDPSNTYELDGIDGLPESGTGDELAEYVFEKHNKFSISPCRYAIKRSFYNSSGISFKPGLKQEDELFTPLLIAAAQSFGSCRSKYYLYRRLEGSRNNIPTIKNKLSFLTIADELLDSCSKACSAHKAAMLKKRGRYLFRRGLMEHNEVIKDGRSELISAAAEVYSRHPEAAEDAGSLCRLIKLLGTKRGISTFLRLYGFINR